MLAETEFEPTSKCSASTKSGKPCSAWASKGGLCWRHAQTPEEASAQGRAGALASRSSKLARRADRAAAVAKEAMEQLPLDLVVKLDSQEGIRLTLESLILATADGRLSAAKSRAIQALVKTQIDAQSLAISAKLVELERLMTQGNPKKVL